MEIKMNKKEDISVKQNVYLCERVEYIQGGIESNAISFSEHFQSQEYQLCVACNNATKMYQNHPHKVQMNEKVFKRNGDALNLKHEKFELSKSVKCYLVQLMKRRVMKAMMLVVLPHILVKNVLKQNNT